MDIKQTKTGFANLPDEKKEFAGKAQMPENMSEYRDLNRVMETRDHFKKQENLKRSKRK